MVSEILLGRAQEETLLKRPDYLMFMKVETIKKIINYGDRYIEKHLTGVFDIDLMLKNWWKGLQFFLSRSFYQGRRDTISMRVEEKAMNVLKKYIEDNGNDATVLLNENNFPDIKNALREVIGKGKIGRGRDIEMVISILDFVSKLEEKNIVNYSISKIKSGTVKEHFYELQKIISIGPKITSFYLRDLICMYSLDKHMSNEDLIFLQPIDTWVRKVALKVRIIDDIDEQDSSVREKIIKACLDLNISTIKFNQGAWFLGYNSFDIVIENLDKI
ncbi:MAG TPA: hypothetical protein VJK07_04550 [Candidatus Nanoarchaeia archaeon]|nr:hypothetical protein [Candidatus Nanoarchaeia archaeon]